MNDQVLIVGFSGRAAASSARRAGFTPIVIDCFADRDTQAIAETHKCPPADFPGGLLTIAAKLPKLPVVFTGGMEHHPEIVAALRGPSKSTDSLVEYIKNIRNHVDANAVYRDSVTRYLLPPTYTDRIGVPPEMTMLTKPIFSGGGVGVRFAGPNDPQTGYVLVPYYKGVPHSASLRMSTLGAQLHGVTRQLVGESWLNAKDFLYCGNISEKTLLKATADDVERWAYITSMMLHCNHHWGVDFILTSDGQARIIEINPRYTASMEVLEHQSGRAILAHEGQHDVPAGEVGKAIYYALHDLAFPEHEDFDRAVEVAVNDPWALPEYADIPHAGDLIPTGAPVLTLLTRQPTAEACIDALKAKAAFLDSLFARCR